jgi:hypothetical protein
MYSIGAYLKSDPEVRRGHIRKHYLIGSIQMFDSERNGYLLQTGEQIMEAIEHFSSATGKQEKV